MHPNGQLPAYEWAFGDVNPPLHAWAALRVARIDGAATGAIDFNSLERILHKLLINFHLVGVCLIGVGSSGRTLSIDAGALNTDLVRGNRVIVGSVNASWLQRLITRRVPIDDWTTALERRADDVNVVIDFTAETSPADSA